MATLLRMAEAVNPASFLVDTGQTSSPVVEAVGHAESLVETAHESSGLVKVPIAVLPETKQLLDSLSLTSLLQAWDGLPGTSEPVMYIQA
eukprot:SM000025S08477  [mRNA]  locus=s25:958550:959468:- [translate_table: standard]